MKLGFEFSSLLGVAYKKGNVLFTGDGHYLIVPVGGRVSVYDLINSSSSYTMPYDHKSDIKEIAISPDSSMLISVDEEGHVVIASFGRRSVLHRFTLDPTVKRIVFSPDCRRFAVALDRLVQLWGLADFQQREFAPLTLLLEIPGSLYGSVNWIDWNEQRILVSSTDMTVKIIDCSLDDKEDGEGANRTVVSLVGHRDVVLAAWWISSSTVLSVSRDGSCACWKLTDSTWQPTDKTFISIPNEQVTSVALSATKSILTVGYSNGTFHIYELHNSSETVSLNKLHELKIASNAINTIDLNGTGEWIAFGCGELGQLVVWEWQSETFILKQQGHFSNASQFAWSDDGEVVATGGEDGKIKLWNTRSCFSYATFGEHTAAVTGLRFCKRSSVLVSCSNDGTVRAFDLVRYRNFRTFTAPLPVQFSCVSVDSSGDLVVAGCSDSFELYVWSMTTGSLVERVTGHEGPISGVEFDPMSHYFASCSWDRTVRLWDIFSDERQTALWSFPSEPQCLAYSCDSKQIAVSLLNGDIALLNPATQSQSRTLAARWDISGGRRAGDKFTSNTSTLSKYFTTLHFSPDSQFLIGGGNSKWICLYNLEQGVLVKKWATTRNRNIDGILEKLNSNNLRADGSSRLIVDRQQSTDRADNLPGCASGEFSWKRRTFPSIRTTLARFSPTGRAWAASTTKGVLVYSLDHLGHFDPIDLDVSVTPQSLGAALKEQKFLHALLISLRLNDAALVSRVLDSVPLIQIPIVCQQIPAKYLSTLYGWVATHIECVGNGAVERSLSWIQSLLRVYSLEHLGSCRTDLLGAMRRWRKSVQDVATVVKDRARTNLFIVKYLETLSKLQ